jgi:hypothetical protein
MPFKDKSFDYVIAAHVLEHTPYPEKFLAEVTRVAVILRHRHGFMKQSWLSYMKSAPRPSLPVKRYRNMPLNFTCAISAKIKSGLASLIRNWILTLPSLDAPPRAFGY